MCLSCDKVENFKLEAVKVAEKSSCAFQHGCLIIRNGKIVATGYNDEYNHAERNAVENLQRLLCCSTEGKDR